MSKIRVSVVVPVFNAHQYLSRCITSLLNQTYSNFELILINDGSTDESEEILKQFAIRDSRVKYYTQVNSGPSVARNKGIEQASGEFICFIDADDVVYEGYLESLIQMVSQGYDIVTCGYIEVSQYGQIPLNDFYRSLESLTKNEFIEGILRGVGGTLWGKIYRRHIIEAHELRLNSNVYMCEDLLFNLNYCLYAQKFAAIEPYLYEYNRLNEGSITSKVTLSYLNNNDIVIEEMRQLLQALGWKSEKIESLLTQRMISLTFSIASNESLSVRLKGLNSCCNQLELLIKHPSVQRYFNAYNPSKRLLDNGGYYLKHKKLRHAVISFYVTEQLRRLKLWIKKRGRI